MAQYEDREIIAIYALGRLYFEMGYFAPAERIFQGIAQIAPSLTAARLGLGLIKLERGLYTEAVPHLRQVIEQDELVLEAKLALVLCFIALREFPRAKSLLVELAPELEVETIPSNQRILWEACVLRCEAS